MLNRNFLLLFGNRAVTRIAYNLSTFTLMIWVFQLTGSNAAVSLWLVMFFISSVTFSLISGVVSDNFDRRKIMIFSNLLWGLLVLGFIPAQYSFPLILLVTLATQAMDEFFSPAQNSSIPEIVPDGTLLRANALWSTASYAASFLGYFLSGVMLRFTGYSSPFMVSAALVLLGASLSFGLPPLKRKGGMDAAKFFRLVGGKIKEQFLFLKATPNVRSTVILLAVLSAGGTSAGALAPGFAEQVLKIDARDLSFIGVVPFAAGLGLGALILGKWGKIWDVWQSVLGFGIAILLLTAAPAMRGYLVNHVTVPQAFEQIPFLSLTAAFLIFAVGIFVSTISVPIMTSLQRITPWSNLGRTYGSVATVAAVLTTFLSLTAGTAADLFTPALPIGVVGAVAVLAAFWVRAKVVIK
ncbi:MAG: MFS transporter [candidate division WWE3 bacterium]|nr:MFS transporter [candidate division WWE3 bacterium]